MVTQTIAPTYPPIRLDHWSRSVERWNSPRTSPAMRQEAADRCRRAGHDLRESPVGPWCRCCCAYFGREGE